MSEFLAYLHLFGLAVSLGSGIFFILLVFFWSKSVPDQAIRMKGIADSLRVFHPLFLFGICLVFMSGAIHLTTLKIGFGSRYFETFGRILLSKFGMTLLIFLVAGMQCFGMGLKFQRMVYGVIEGDLAKQARYAKKIWRAQVMNLLFLAITLWLGLKMGALTHVP